MVTEKQRAFHYNANPTGDSSLLSYYDIDPRPPSEDQYMYMITDVEYLLNFDFKNFSFFIFEQDLIDLDDDEFKWWFENVFKNWLYKLSELYLDINYDEVAHKFESAVDRKTFLLRVIDFVMNVLPYDFLGSHFIKNNDTVKSVGSLIDYLDSDSNLIKLRDEIINFLHDNRNSYDRFVSMLQTFSQTSTRNFDFQRNIEIVANHIDRRNSHYQFFTELIEDCDMHKLRDFFVKAAENDSIEIIQ